MRPIAIAAAVFLATNLLVVAFLPAIFRVADYDGQATIARLVDYLDAPRADVAFMGSSTALNGFDPRLAEREIAKATGASVRVYNWGVTGAFVDLSYLVLKNLIPGQSQPRVVVYGLRDIELVSKHPNIHTLPYVPSILAADDFSIYYGRDRDSVIDFLLAELLPLYRHQQLLRSAASIALLPWDPRNRDFRSGSRDPDKTAWNRIDSGLHAPDRAGERTYRPPLRSPYFDGPMIDRMRRFLELARARGIDVVLVNLPVTPTQLGYWRTPEDVDTYTALVARLAGESGAELVDLYRNPGRLIPDAAFYDTNHLTEDGAAILTREIVRRSLARRFAAAG